MASEKKPQAAHSFLIAILVMGSLLAFTVPRTLTGKFLMMAVVVVVAVGVFVALFMRTQKEKEDREAQFLIEALREHKAAAAAPAAASPAPAAPVQAPRWTLELLQRLEARRLEVVCAAYFKALGYRVVAAGLGSNGGADIRLHAGDAPKPTHAVMCSAGNGTAVGIKPVRELAGAMALEDIAEGIFVAAGAFSAEARQLGARSARKIFFMDGREFLARLDALPPDKAQALLRLASP